MRRAGVRRLGGLGIAAAALPVAGLAAAQTAPPPADPAASTQDAAEVVVRGHRIAGSAIGTIEPVAVLDADALKGLGATSMPELVSRLQGLATSGAGGDPALLLNGRRVSGFEELYALPFEAIERTEILSEQDAARLGFPPTVRVMNFITKKHFRSLRLVERPGITTGGGGATDFVEVNAARVDEGRRAAVTLGYTHQDRILQSQRGIVPDPSVPFAATGNVVAASGGGSIDPALDALAGHPVAIAAVPVDPAARRRLASYAAVPPAITDIGPYRTLQPTLDRLRLDATVARPVGKVDLSANLSAQQDWTAGLNGLASGTIAVPTGSPALAFEVPVAVDRYVPGTVLAQHGSVTTAHAGVTAQGGAGRWAWSVTGRYDRAVNRFASETGVPLDALQAAVTAGGDPLQPLDPAAAAQRIVVRGETRTDTLGARGVANGPLVALPAGDALLTLTADYSRSSSRPGGGEPGAAADALSRSVTGATAALDVPIVSADRGVLGFAGRLGVNALVGVTAVSGYRRLATTNLGVNWSPRRPVQLLGSINDTRTAPAIALLVDPPLVTPNVPVFDYVRGTSVLVTTTSGGNPALGPERRRVGTLTLAVTPKRDVHLTLDYVDTLIEGQSASLANVTAPFQAAFGSLFTRDAAGTLVAVDLRPVNLARERERKLHWSLAGNVTLGHAPLPAPAPAPGAAQPSPPPPPPKPRVALYTFLSGNYRLSDRLALGEGSLPLDLLGGASLTGTGGRPRWDVDGTIGGSYGPLNLGVYSQLQGPTRIGSHLASADLRFSGRVYLVYYTDLDLGALVKRGWAKRLLIDFTLDNLLDDRIVVRDRDGAIPNRFQGGYLDPVGRSIRLGVRKLF